MIKKILKVSLLGILASLYSSTSFGMQHFCHPDSNISFQPPSAVKLSVNLDPTMDPLKIRRIEFFEDNKKRPFAIIRPQEGGDSNLKDFIVSQKYKLNREEIEKEGKLISYKVWPELPRTPEFRARIGGTSAYTDVMKYQVGRIDGNVFKEWKQTNAPSKRVEEIQLRLGQNYQKRNIFLIWN
jgi:hypothetical protein